MPLLLGLALLRPAWREGLGERLGLRGPPKPPTDDAPVWIHGASVGEAQAALRLADLLVARGERVVLSTTTTTGRDVLRRARPQWPTVLAPLDHPWCVRAALGRACPRALLLVETELWPSWIAAAYRRGVPVVLVSGRLSDRSFPRYRRLARWLAPTLRRLRAVGARSEEDAARFRALGVAPERVEVTGDLKWEPAPEAAPLEPALAACLAACPYWVAGSTHPGEEGAALEATRASGQALALVVAPRHPERVDEAVASLEASGAKVHRRSQPPLPELSPGDVLVLDTLGELAGVYRGARAAFVGGTLVPVGGHNLLEPLQAGVPVFFGPYTANAREPARLLEDTGAGLRVEGAEGLSAALAGLADDPMKAPLERGRAVLEGHRGAATRSLALVERVLAAQATPS